VSKGRVVFDEDRCKGCELCIDVCPQDVIRIASHFNARGYQPATLVDPEGKCTGCAMCAVICPDVVITVYRWEKPKPAARRQKAQSRRQPVLSVA
jgi:2-oxoglutarate ferredoxin oxidoreductase subunit delta